VDKRTIEKFEREAKQLNRESWFLAFIMDTNEVRLSHGLCHNPSASLTPQLLFNK
jgi:peptide chain release factor subunit 3